MGKDNEMIEFYETEIDKTSVSSVPYLPDPLDNITDPKLKKAYKNKDNFNRNSFNRKPVGKLKRKNSYSKGEYVYDPEGTNEFIDDVGVSWFLLSDDLNIYHNDNKAREAYKKYKTPFPNKKFLAPDSRGGSFEAIINVGSDNDYDPKKDYINNSKLAGTYNYDNPGDLIGKGMHVLTDVIPYYVNDEQEETLFHTSEMFEKANLKYQKNSDYNYDIQSLLMPGWFERKNSKSIYTDLINIPNNLNKKSVSNGLGIAIGYGIGYGLGGPILGGTLRTAGTVIGKKWISPIIKDGLDYLEELTDDNEITPKIAQQSILNISNPKIYKNYGNSTIIKDNSIYQSNYSSETLLADNIFFKRNKGTGTLKAEDSFFSKGSLIQNDYDNITLIENDTLYQNNRESSIKIQNDTLYQRLVNTNIITTELGGYYESYDSMTKTYIPDNRLVSKTSTHTQISNDHTENEYPSIFDEISSVFNGIGFNRSSAINKTATLLGTYTLYNDIKYGKQALGYKNQARYLTELTEEIRNRKLDMQRGKITRKFAQARKAKKALEQANRIKLITERGDDAIRISGRFKQIGDKIGLVGDVAGLAGGVYKTYDALLNDIDENGNIISTGDRVVAGLEGAKDIGKSSLSIVTNPIIAQQIGKTVLAKKLVQKVGTQVAKKGLQKLATSIVPGVGIANGIYDLANGIDTLTKDGPLTTDEKLDAGLNIGFGVLSAGLGIAAVAAAAAVAGTAALPVIAVAATVGLAAFGISKAIKYFWGDSEKTEAEDKKKISLPKNYNPNILKIYTTPIDKTRVHYTNPNLYSMPKIQPLGYTLSSPPPTLNFNSSTNITSKTFNTATQQEDYIVKELINYDYMQNMTTSRNNNAVQLKKAN